MNTLSRTITGVFLIILGIVLIVVSVFFDYWTLAYAIPSLIIGFFIIFNKKEDEIEPIKMQGSKK
tara:strand:- start:1227 stop:1421 length:195 start_codon:yes stop_codon:yes gene_type:complete